MTRTKKNEDKGSVLHSSGALRVLGACGVCRKIQSKHMCMWTRCMCISMLHVNRIARENYIVATVHNVLEPAHIKSWFADYVSALCRGCVALPTYTQRNAVFNVTHLQPTITHLQTTSLIMWLMLWPAERTMFSALLCKTKPNRSILCDSMYIDASVRGCWQA